MKTFRQYIKESVITEGVSDLPSDLRNLINKNYSMADFTKDIYDASHKDLNELVMSDNNIRSGKKISASDIDKITRDGIYLVVDLGSDGMLLAGRGMFNYVFDDKRRYSTVYVNNRNYDIDSPRNIATVLNTDQFKDAKYWLIDLSNAKSTEDIRKERAEAQRGIVQRYNDTWYGTTDKSGYKVDRRKYDEMLQKLKIEGNDYVNQLAEISSRFFKAMANPNAKKHNWDVEKAIDAIKTATNYSVSNYYKPSEVKEKIKKADDAVKVIENYAKVNESVNNTHRTFKQYLTEGCGKIKESLEDDKVKTVEESVGQKLNITLIRKPSNMKEVEEAMRRGYGDRVKAVVDKVYKLSKSDYEKFIYNFMAHTTYLNGEGGIDPDGTVHVIEISAPGQKTIYVDPEGYDYARYVGW